MATLTIKNLPDNLYRRLKELAAAHRRSLNSEAILAVERAVSGEEVRDPNEVLVELRSARRKVENVFITDAALQKARASGRA
jgi:plasmid stability protein